MGCGCGKRRVSRLSKSGTSVAVKRSGASRVEAAKVYQSATVKTPTAPVTRKTV